MSCPKTSLPRPMLRGFSTLFSSRRFTVSGLTFVFNLSQFNFCELYEKGIEFHYCVCEYLIIPAPFIEETILFPLSILGFIVKY